MILPGIRDEKASQTKAECGRGSYRPRTALTIGHFENPNGGELGGHLEPARVN